MEKKTPLYDLHLKLGGRMVPFAGYLLPVQYETGVIAEHKAVREACGLFDVSHMGELRICGKDALNNINMLLTNNFTDLDTGRVRYSPMCNASGGIVDDLIVYKFDQDDYLLVVNAANKDKDAAWIKSHLQGEARMGDESDSYAQLALQGPKSREVLARVADPEGFPAKYYSFVQGIPVAGVSCLLSRTGYTGEYGYELYCAPQQAVQLAEALLGAGRDLGLIPCGLGARDTLRLEAGMPLYGHEMNDEITPLEAGLGSFVRMDKEEFIGKAALLEKGEPDMVRVGLSLLDRGIARENSEVYVNNIKIGQTTSGTLAPYINKAVAMARVGRDFSEPGTRVVIDVRGRKLAAEVVPMPFYQRPKGK
ncbi:MAG: glycine cleavage system aminomethyltransferase GcvT [Eubacteriales bacterium]|nr:glycine cleavage system aminomethyltransferase GcvT [Eubacteriales bacterium]